MPAARISVVDTHESFLLMPVPPAYYVAFGPHGPRAPIDPPGTTPKIIAGVVGLLATTAVIFFSIRATGTYSPCLAHVSPA